VAQEKRGSEMNFWVWFDEQMWARPYNLKEDGEHLKLNTTTLAVLKSMPEVALVMAVISEMNTER
jgi:hypothetical protein